MSNALDVHTIATPRDLEGAARYLETVVQEAEQGVMSVGISRRKLESMRLTLVWLGHCTEQQHVINAAVDAAVRFLDKRNFNNRSRRQGVAKALSWLRTLPLASVPSVLSGPSLSNAASTSRPLRR